MKTKREIRRLLGILILIWIISNGLYSPFAYAIQRENLCISGNDPSDMHKLNAPYLNPTPGKISIVAATPIPTGVMPEEYMFEEIRKCGFDIVFFNGSVQEIESVLGFIKKSGLKIMPTNGSLRNNECHKFVSKLKDVPELAGWDFIDEPKFSTLNDLKKYYKIIQKEDPNHIILINLIGIKMKAFTGNSPSFESYLDTIQKIFAPSFWSYDFYPISVKDGKVKVAADMFYKDLEIFSRISKRTKRPFWAYCQTMAFKNSIIERPAATLSYLRYTVFSALAYGSQGIVYWTYGQRKNTSEEKYISALVNYPYQKMPAWNAVQQVNSEINKFNHVFYNSTLIDCRHTGMIYDGTKQLKDSFGPFNKIEGDNRGVMVSHLHTADKDYIIIINHDVFNKQNVSFSLKKGFFLESLMSLKIIRGTYTETLSSGGYAIYRFCRD